MIECRSCGKKMVGTFGKSSAPLLLIGEAVTFEDLRVDRPFMGEVGDVLRAELIRAGVQYNDCRATMMWRHDPKVDKEFKAGCYNQMMELLLQEVATARAVLLLGAGVTKELLGVTVSKVNGCQVPLPKLFPSTVEVVVASVAPGTALSMSVGDFRLACQRFAQYTKEIRKR